MLEKQKISDSLKAFIAKVNESPQEDSEKAIQDYCDNMERVIYEAIKDITITIPPGRIVVVVGGIVGANIDPIVIDGISIS